jgi:23S rRNA (cytosine1962-C5)-methyltransferase
MYLSPRNFKEYELIDSGGFEKLERFGEYILARPESQAVWNKSIPDVEWKKMYHAQFRRMPASKESGPVQDRGEWIFKKEMPEQWFISYEYRGLSLSMRLGLTSFGHIGIFPEQSENWNFIYDTVDEIKHKKPVVLNLFAYTGAASLAARSAGAEVVHVDSVKQVVGWARENMEKSKLSNIHWIIEDAMKYVQREVKRGKQYHGIILDPPAYGRGPAGEKWLLDRQINELTNLCSRILLPRNSFFMLSMYSLSYSSLISENLIKSNFNDSPDLESGELFVPDRSGKKLPLGTFLRFRR